MEKTCTIIIICSGAKTKDDDDDDDARVYKHTYCKSRYAKKTPETPTTQDHITTPLYFKFMLYDSSSFLSVSTGAISSPPGLSEATMGAIAGAGVDDLFALAACNL
jgi:hypothetical protein